MSGTASVSTIMNFSLPPPDADVKLNPSLLEGLASTLSPEGESGNGDAAVKKEGEYELT